MNLKTSVGFCISLFATVLTLNNSAVAQEKPSITASRTVNISATVTSIDHETRAVTLEGSQGEAINFTASPDVRNIDQVQAGDLVFAQLHEEVSIEVFANPEGVQPGAGEIVAEARAEMGDMPAGGVVDTVVITAIVEDINLDSKTFRLRGPEGTIREFAARDPENLKRAEVGDLVVITIMQAMGIMVEHPGE